MSRAGITITAARILKFNRLDSSKISFLLSIPALTGASLIGFKDLFHQSVDFNYLIIFAIISSFIVQVWFNDSLLSLIISISMIITMIVAGLFGIVVPVTLKKLKIDPAIASSVFVTTITDVIGFVSFLGVGAYYL